MRNIEIKARLKNLSDSMKVAARLTTEQPRARLRQVDTYFNVPNGRLKLREEEGDGARNVLIFYRRADQTGPKRSDYDLVPTDAPAALKQALSDAIGVRIVVAKQRTLFLHENVRIHLDEVDGLGDFLEFEAVMPDESPDSEGQAQLHKLMLDFSIGQDDLIEDSYCDLLERQNHAI